MKEKNEERNIERTKVKKNTLKLNNKFDLSKNYESTKNAKALRYYSTKIVINFVPQLKPKKSFLKPTFFQLNKDDKDESEKSFELDKISSCDEVEDNESNDSSSIISSFSSDNEKDKEDNNNKENQSQFTLDENKKKEKKWEVLYLEEEFLEI